MTVIEVKENGAIRTKMLSCDSPFFYCFIMEEASESRRDKRKVV